MDTSSSDATPKQPQPSQSDAAAFATDGPSIAATRPPEQPTSEFVKPGSVESPSQTATQTQALAQSLHRTACDTCLHFGNRRCDGERPVCSRCARLSLRCKYGGNVRPSYAPKVYIACDPCRRRKIKCDGVRPICGKCEDRHNVEECTYAETQRTRGRAKRPRTRCPSPDRHTQRPRDGKCPSPDRHPNHPEYSPGPYPYGRTYEASGEDRHEGDRSPRLKRQRTDSTSAEPITMHFHDVRAAGREPGTYIRDGHAHACDERHREYPYPPGPYPYEYDDYRRRPPPPGWERVPYPPSGWERVPRPMLGWEYGSPMWPGWEHPPPGWVPVDDWRRWERYPSPPVSYDQWGWPLPVWERPPPGYDVWGRPVYPGWGRMAPSTSVSAHGRASEERSRSTKRSSRSPTAAHGVLASAPVPATSLDIQPSPSASQAVGHQSAAEARQPPAIDGKAAASAEHAPPDVMRDTDEKAYSGWENRGKPIVVFGWDGEVTQADSPSANASAAEAEDGANCAASGGANPPTDGALANGPDSVAETIHPVVDVEKENSSPLVQQSVSTVDANETKLNVPSDVNASAALPQTAPSGTHAKTTLRSLASAAIPPSSPNITNGVPSTGAADGQTSVDVSAGSALDAGETVFSQAVVRCTGPLLEGVEQAASKYSVAAGGVVLTNDDGVQHAQEDGSVVVKDTAPTA